MNRQEHLANKELQRQKKIDAGLISDRFPKVSSIVINMTYHKKLPTQALLVRTIYFSPDSYAYFKMGCLTKKCDNGGFELTRLVKSMVKKKSKLDKGNLACNGKNIDIASDHAKISYEINIKYNNKKSKK